MYLHFYEKSFDLTDTPLNECWGFPGVTRPYFETHCSKEMMWKN